MTDRTPKSNSLSVDEIKKQLTEGTLSRAEAIRLARFGIGESLSSIKKLIDKPLSPVVEKIEEVKEEKAGIIKRRVKSWKDKAKKIIS